MTIPVEEKLPERSVRVTKILPDGSTNASADVPIHVFRASRVGAVNAAYADIVAVFGGPEEARFDETSDAEWFLETPDGMGSIYNYKNGRKYLGSKGKDVEDIESWSISGRTGKVVDWIGKVLGESRVQKDPQYQ